MSQNVTVSYQVNETYIAQFQGRIFPVICKSTDPVVFAPRAAPDKRVALKNLDWAIPKPDSVKTASTSVEPTPWPFGPGSPGWEEKKDENPFNKWPFPTRSSTVEKMTEPVFPKTSPIDTWDKDGQLLPANPAFVPWQVGEIYKVMLKGAREWMLFKCTETSVEATSRIPRGPAASFIDAYDIGTVLLTKAQAEHYQKYHADQERLSGK